jgi:tRNA threonylcarbamoyladenosine biosynthesis protein TsaE
MKELTLALPDVAATELAGRALAGALGAGMIVTLAGDLGAGKTTLARGVLRGLGWTGRVKSPTYALVEHYPLSNLYLYHFDLFRFEDPAEWDDAGVAECFRPDALCIVEWPERARGRLPPADLDITLRHCEVDESGEGRILTATANTGAGERCLDVLAGAMRHAG